MIITSGETFLFLVGGRSRFDAVLLGARVDVWFDPSTANELCMILFTDKDIIGSYMSANKSFIVSFLSSWRCLFATPWRIDQSLCATRYSFWFFVTTSVCGDPCLSVSCVHPVPFNWLWRCCLLFLLTANRPTISTGLARNRFSD